MVIPGFSSYDVDEHGVVTNLRTGETVKSRMSGGYHTVTLTHNDGRRCVENVHVLMANAFNLPDGYRWVVTFKDGDSTNIELSNLERISRNELSRRHYNPGQSRRKSICNTPESRQYIVDAMEALDMPMKMTDLSEYLGLPYSTVRYSIYHLVGIGVVKRVQGGYILNVRSSTDNACSSTDSVT